jgi:hypothetical protein
MINPDEIKSNTNLSNGLNIKPEVLPTKTTTPVPLVSEPLVSEPLTMPKFGAEATSYYETLQPRYAELAKAEGELEKFKMQNEAAKTKNQFEATKVYKTNVDALNLQAEQKENEYPRPEFHPTKENLASLGSLFSMVSTLGMIVGASGKAGANNAMSAMTGMLKGWQSGRKDLYEKEVKEFDKEYKRITDIRNEIQKKLEKSIALESTNKELAFLEKEGARQLAGSDSVMGKTIAVKGAKAGIDLIINATNVETQYQKLASDAKNRAEDRALRLQLAELKSGGTDRYGFGNIIATNVNEAVGSIANIVMLPESSTTGFFQGRNTSGLINAPLGALTNNLTSEDIQRYNVEIGNFGKFASRVVSGGRVVPATVQKDFDEQYKLREGDKPLTVLTKIAQMRQTLERASEVYIADPKTPEGIRDIYQKGLSEIRTAIPFTVNDINNIAKEKDKKKTFAEAFVEFGLKEQATKPTSSRFQEERNEANKAIKEGAPRDAVAKRFKTNTGEDF